MRLPRLVSAVLLVTLLGVGAAAFAWRGDEASPGSLEVARRASSRVEPIRVLRSWDAARASAWADGDRRALSELYVPGSRAGRADLALLASYADRRLRVRGLVPQLLAVEVLTSRDDLLRLRVTDRLARAVAVGRGRPRPLPRDEPSTRLVTLRRAGDGWQVRGVQPAR